MTAHSLSYGNTALHESVPQIWSRSTAGISQPCHREVFLPGACRERPLCRSAPEIAGDEIFFDVRKDTVPNAVRSAFDDHQGVSGLVSQQVPGDKETQGGRIKVREPELLLWSCGHGGYYHMMGKIPMSKQQKSIGSVFVFMSEAKGERRPLNPRRFLAMA